MKVDLCETLEELTDEELNHEYVQFALEYNKHLNF